MATESRNRWRHQFFFSVNQFIPWWPSKMFRLIRCSILHMQLWRHNKGIYDIKTSHQFPMRSTYYLPSFNCFLGAVSDSEVQSFSVFPTWLPQLMAYDVIIIIETFYMSSRTNGENLVSIWQAVTEKNMKVLWGQTDRQTNRQTDRQQTNGLKCNSLSFGEGNKLLPFKGSSR